MAFTTVVTNYQGMRGVAGGGGLLVSADGCCGVRGGEEVKSTEPVLGEVVALDFHIILVLVVHVQSVIVRAVAVFRRQL